MITNPSDCPSCSKVALRKLGLRLCLWWRHLNRLPITQDNGGVMGVKSRIVEDPPAAVSESQIDTSVSSKQLLCNGKRLIVKQRLSRSRRLSAWALADINATDIRYSIPRVPSSLPRKCIR